MKVKITTTAGMTLIADTDKIEILDDGSVRCSAWLMRYGLIENRSYCGLIRGSSIKSTEYLKG